MSNYGLLGFPERQLRNAGLFGWPIGALSKGAQPPMADTGTSGVAVAPSNSANTLGAWTTLLDPAPYTADGFYIYFLTTTGGIADYLFDFGIGGSGDNIHTILVEGVYYCGSTSADIPGWLYVPMSVPGGTRLAARCQISVAAGAGNTVATKVQLVRGGLAERLRCSRSETLGFARSDSGGAQVDPGGSANTKGAYTVVGTTTRPMDFANVMLGKANVTQTAQNCMFDIALRPQREIIAPNFQYRTGTGPDCFVPMNYDMALQIPAQTEVAVRAQSSTTDATDRLVDFVIVGYSL